MYNRNDEINFGFTQKTKKGEKQMTESYESPFTKEVKECVCEKIGISKDKFDKGDYDKFPEATAGCILNIHEKNQKAKEKKETSFLDMQVNWTNTSIKT